MGDIAATPGPAHRPKAMRSYVKEPLMTPVLALRARRAALGALVAASIPTAFADSSIHSGPLRAITGSGDEVVCIVRNVGKNPIDTLRVRISNAEFLATNDDVTCTDVPVGGACRGEFQPGGLPFIVHFACTADSSGKEDAIRGTFYRRSTVGTSGDLAIELR